MGNGALHPFIRDGVWRPQLLRRRKLAALDHPANIGHLGGNKLGLILASSALVLRLTLCTLSINPIPVGIDGELLEPPLIIQVAQQVRQPRQPVSVTKPFVNEVTQLLLDAGTWQRRCRAASCPEPFLISWERVSTASTCLATSPLHR